MVAENRAITQEDLATYEKTVVQALSDVETALTQLRYATEQEAIQRLAVQEAELATTVARAQLAAGTVDITTLITAQQTQLQDENTLVTRTPRPLPGSGGAVQSPGWRLATNISGDRAARAHPQPVPHPMSRA